ncbi:guanosine monophosphate reductase [Halobiforma lacisalsi AJ5]|uniref:GMP reductase n=1 Tax=Natronobacterium lacisalsi AJ5 TaxID=358396 RepID=M0LGR9_NATLA|nr:guanosine monophosphate reductase [Halobiforma lacisalsi]APW99488.1 guanosine monophosphate reductase [Halobiforma lacisalsi AJ5]EMA31609.1 GMP reductase [Halobiforma lacisalsi AJ5]
MDELRTGLSYGDVLLVPQRSPVDSRSDVDLSTNLTPNIELETPLVSAAMDTVTESDLAIALAESGGIGTIHRFLTVDEQAAEVETVADAGHPVTAAVGINEDYVDRTAALLEAGASAIVVDVAHGHLERALDATAELRSEFPGAELIAGNVATPDGVEDLYEAGADSVKVGIGPGSHCTTRKVAGAGVPQLTAVDDCAEVARDLGITIVADGGIRTSGDAVKALMAGADTVMMGSLFAGTDEAPSEIVTVDGVRYKRSRGMATTAAAEDRDDKPENVDADEGVEGLTPYKGPAADVAEEFCAGIRSGLSYCGGHTIPAAREKAEFIRVAASAQEREGAHTDDEWETVSVDSVGEAATNADD